MIKSTDTATKQNDIDSLTANDSFVICDIRSCLAVAKDGLTGGSSKKARKEARPVNITLVVKGNCSPSPTCDFI